VSLFVDTSAWSLALRRDQPAGRSEVGMLVRALESGETLLTTGLVLQELLQGFAGPKSRSRSSSAFLRCLSSYPIATITSMRRS
jgi:predicted nucleic acid-binding protein